VARFRKILSSKNIREQLFFRGKHRVRLSRQVTHPHDLDAAGAAPLRTAAKSKIDDYRAQYANNQKISFLPVITSTCTRMRGEFLRLLFLQAHRGAPSECHRPRNASATTLRFISLPLRGVLQWREEQSWSGCGESDSFD